MQTLTKTEKKINKTTRKVYNEDWKLIEKRTNLPRNLTLDNEILYHYQH